MSDDEDVRKDTLGKLTDLAGIGAVVHVSYVDRDGQEYLISRDFDGYKNSHRIRTRESATPLEINVRDRFPVHAYSQGEALSIARNRKAQLDLIDKHLPLEIRQHQHDIEDSYKFLQSQIEGLTRLESTIRDRTMFQEDLALYENKITELNSDLEKIKEIQQDATVASHQLWISERTYLTEVVNSIAKTREKIMSLFDSIDFPILDVPFPEKDTPNKELLTRVKDNASSINELKNAASQLMTKGLDELEAKIRGETGPWKESYAQHKKDYDAITEGHAGLKTKEINDQIEHFEKKRFDVQSKLKSINLATTELNRQMQFRKEHIAIIRDRKARIATLRARKVKEILKNVSKLRISLKPNANRENYAEFLDETITMRGSHQKPRIIEAICNTIEPFRLAELIRSGDSATFQRLSNISGDWAQKILEQFRAIASTSYQIETLPTDDYLEISLEVNGEIKPLEKLSVGQKATVIVSLSLVEGSSPVLFDQPEDALYSPFIVEHIVQLVKASKDQRQFIFATHNPNIAVGPDLDLGIILEGSSNETAIKASGGMDDTETNKLVVLYLEGGEDAIRGRLREYGLNH